MSDTTDAVHEGVGVAMLTYRRPEDLEVAIPALLTQVEAFPGAEILIVDNDTEPSAASTVAGWSKDHPVRYVHEPTPGIAAARNRALDELADRELVIFIDDDERPEPGWLETLVATFREHECVGVAGRVRSRIDGPVDPWIVHGGWFTRPSRVTGQRMPVVATNNLLLDVAAVHRLGVRFDNAFGLTGGSDTVFSLEVSRRGGRFVWCDEAVVVDVVPAARATRRWVVRRAYRSGNSRSRAQIHVTRGRLPRMGVRARLAAGGLARLVAGGLPLAVHTLLRQEARASAATRRAVRGAGMLVGAFGRAVVEYAR